MTRPTRLETNQHGDASTVWYLSGQVDESEGVRQIPINTFPFKVGRRSDLPLALPCSCVSKEHAELIVRDGDIWIRDLGSTNGSYVNGEQISGEAVLAEGDLVQFATVVFRLGRQQQHTEGHTLHEDACDRALAMMQFDRLINDGGVVPFFQPIVMVDTQETYGYEVLGRSRLFGLKTPAEMFSAASQLNLEAELSRLLRAQGMQLANQLPVEFNIFLNTHPIELSKDGLDSSLRQLREISPHHPITLEIHEAAITNPALIHSLREVLDDLDMKLAFDDFGVGRARLVELSEVRPDFVKFDMKLTRDIHKAPKKRQEVVALIAKMVNDLGIYSLAEGVECQESHDILKDMNFKMAQGFYYGKPASITQYVPEASEETDLGSL